MADLREYENKDGYRIRATSRAYELYHRKQGFRPVEALQQEQKPEASGSCFSEMKVVDLKKYLTEQGIPFGAKAKREELAALAESAGNHAETGAGSEDMKEAPAANPGIEEA